MTGGRTKENFCCDSKAAERRGSTDMLLGGTLKFVLKICTLLCIYVILQLNFLKTRNFAENLILLLNKHLTFRKQSIVCSNILISDPWKLLSYQ